MGKAAHLCGCSSLKNFGLWICPNQSADGVDSWADHVEVKLRGERRNKEIMSSEAKRKRWVR